MKRYNFDRFQRGRLMAEGVSVHAWGLDEAAAKAAMFREGMDTLQFSDNTPCPEIIGCSICVLARRKAK